MVSGQDAAILQTVFTQSPVGLHVLDHQLRVVRMNAAARALRDTPGHHLLGRPFTEAFGLEDPAEEAAVAHRVLQSGEPVVDRLIRVFEAPGKRGRHSYSVPYFRLEDSHGDAHGLVAATVDVTDRKNAQDRMALVDTVRAQVGHRLNVGAVCEELVEAVVPAFAGTAVVEVIEAVVRGEDPPPVPADRDVALRRAAFRGGISAHPVGDVLPLPADTPYSHVLSDLQPRLISIEEDSSWLAVDPARADAIRRNGAHSLIVAPLALRGRALGIVSFYRHQAEGPFEKEDVAVASSVCAHAALRIDNARRYMREWVIASTLQHRLLPRPPAGQTTVCRRTPERPQPRTDERGQFLTR